MFGYVPDLNPFHIPKVYLNNLLDQSENMEELFVWNKKDVFCSI